MRQVFIFFGGFTVVAVLAGVLLFSHITGDKAAGSLSSETGYWAVLLRVTEVVLLTVTSGSVLLLCAQLWQTSRWNKILSYHEYFGSLVSSELGTKLQEAAEKCEFSANMKTLTPIDHHILEKILLNPSAEVTIISYLDEFEEFCGAVHAGVTDKTYAYKLEGTRVVRAFSVFSPYIDSKRKENEYTRCYVELVKLGQDWKTLKDKELSNILKEQSEINERQRKLDAKKNNNVKPVI